MQTSAQQATRTPLNKANRAAIAHAIIARTFAEALEQFNAGRVALAESAYDKIIPPSFTATANSCPEKWFGRREYVELRSELGKKLTPAHPDDDIYGSEVRMRLSTRRPFPYYMIDSFSTFATILIPAGHPLLDEINNVAAQAEALAANRAAAKDSIYGLLHSVPTLGKLIEIAPELAPLIPNSIRPKPAAASLPAIPAGNVIDQLVKFGLKLK